MSTKSQPELVFDPEDNAAESQADESSLSDGLVLDYITGKLVKENAKELVRQRIARALLHEYGISADDMEPDFKVRVGGKLRKVDIAIFHN